MQPGTTEAPPSAKVRVRGLCSTETYPVLILTTHSVSCFMAPKPDQVQDFQQALSLAFHTEQKLKMGHKVRFADALTINAVVDGLDDPYLYKLCVDLQLHQLHKRRHESEKDFLLWAGEEIRTIQHTGVDSSPFKSAACGGASPIRMHYRTIDSSKSRPRAQVNVGMLWQQVEFIMGDTLKVDGELVNERLANAVKNIGTPGYVSDVASNPDLYAKFLVDTTAVFLTGLAIRVVDQLSQHDTSAVGVPRMPDIFDEWHRWFLKDVLEAWHVDNMCKNAICMTCLQTGSADVKILKCGRCGVASYCSKACQTKNWRKHKPQCCVANSRRELADMICSRRNDATVVDVCFERGPLKPTTGSGLRGYMDTLLDAFTATMLE